MPVPRLSCAALLLTALAFLPACRGCVGSADDAPAHAPIAIAVEIEGNPAPTIDQALLDRIPPDFSEGERRAWRLRSLIGDALDRPGLVIEVEDSAGNKTILAYPDPSHPEREPVLAVNRVGEVRIALVAPTEPFPPFHGRGGNRGRSGDPTRVREVRKIRLIPPPGGSGQ